MDFNTLSTKLKPYGLYLYSSHNLEGRHAVTNGPVTKISFSADHNTILAMISETEVGNHWQNQSLPSQLQPLIAEYSQTKLSLRQIPNN